MGAGPTSIPKAAASVVVVGAPPELIEATRRAAGVAAGARVEATELGHAATVVATCRPFAIVMPEHVYIFDAAEFDALARDVGAVLVRVEDMSADGQTLERLLMPKLGRALRSRKS